LDDLRFLLHRSGLEGLLSHDFILPDLAGLPNMFPAGLAFLFTLLSDGAHVEVALASVSDMLIKGS